MDGLPESSLTCVMHTNQVQVWDAQEGDKFLDFGREQIAQGMMVSPININCSPIVVNYSVVHPQFYFNAYFREVILKLCM